MVSPLVKAYHNLIGDTGSTSTAPASAPPPAPPVQSPIGNKSGTSAAGPSFLAQAAAATTNNLAGGKSLLGQ
jgi:hypothetical protein